MGDQPRPRREAHHPVDAEHGRRGHLRRRPTVARGVQGFPVPPQVRRRSSRPLRQSAGRRLIQGAAPLARPHPRRGDCETRRREAAAIQRRYAVPPGLRRRHRKGPGFAGYLAARRHRRHARPCHSRSRPVRSGAGDLRSGLACMVQRHAPRDPQGCHGHDGHRRAARRSRNLHRFSHAARKQGGARRDPAHTGGHPGDVLDRPSPGAPRVKLKWDRRSVFVVCQPALLLAFLILFLNLWLNAPLFLSGELPFRGSVEGGYVSMARFLSQHPNPWGWNPFPYCGLPVQFMYVPALPYLSALGIRLLPHVSPDLVFRTIVSLAACFGPVTLFFFALYFTRSRRWALVTALAYSFLSPSYGLFPAVEKDRGIVQLPWRIQVLAKYGEGPHNTGLTLLPMALLAVWLAGKRRGYPRILLAAVLLAAIPLCNWVAAFALAISCLLLLLAAWGEPEFQAWRALAAAALAWLLACFWLTPSFVKIIFFNWPVDSFAYQLGRQQVWALAGMVGGALLIRLLFHRLHGSFYLCLATLGGFVFGWIATGFYLYCLGIGRHGGRRAAHPPAVPPAARFLLFVSRHAGRICIWMDCDGVLPVRRGHHSRIPPLRHRVRVLSRAGPGGGIPSDAEEFQPNGPPVCLGERRSVAPRRRAATLGLWHAGMARLAAAGTREHHRVPVGPLDRRTSAPGPP